MARVTEAIAKFFQLLATKTTDSAGNFAHVLSVNIENWAEANFSGGTGGSAGIIGTTITQTVKTSSGVLIAANASRKSLRWMNLDTTPVTVAPGTGVVTAGQGMVYGGAPSAGQQGGSESFTGPTCPTGAFSFIGSSKMVVWEEA